ncbi:MAG: hypothetical protein MUE67_07250 [Anaerolineales bacterium]|jgi:hypothetical protein|nr:hypothetical protein [Anaerolineales bacterium]
MTQETLPDRIELRLWPFFVRLLEQASRLKPGLNQSCSSSRIKPSQAISRQLRANLESALLYLAGLLLGLLAGYLVIGIILI